MKYLTKQAGTEQASYEVKGNNVYRTITSTQPFEGAKQPNPEEKFFTKTEKIKDFAEREALKRRFKTEDMVGFKKAAGCKSKKKGKKKMKYFNKEAALTMEDIEDEVGTYFSDPYESVVRNAIGGQYEKRIGLRHPWVTGIPTLGIWPAISHARAKDEVIRGMARNDANFKSMYIATQRARERDALERYKADSINRAVGTAGTYGIIGASMLKKESTIQNATVKAMGKLRKSEGVIKGLLDAEKAGANATQAGFDTLLKNKMSVRQAENELKAITRKAKYMA